MVEHNRVLIHVDPKGDRIGDSDLTFDGWVAASHPVTAVWLASDRGNPLPLRDRLDVKRVFPGLTAIGFTGICKGKNLGPSGLRLGVQVGNDIFEVEHPLPAPLAKQSKGERITHLVKVGWLRLRERLATTSAQRWRLTLRRHLLHRRQRGDVFRRPHLEALLMDFAAALPEAGFVQIGANDGLTGDPIHDLLGGAGRRWRGVFVEPVEHLFAELSERSARNPALQLERAAIGESDGAIEIYRLRTKPSDPLWLEQLASLDREILRSNAQQFGVPESEIISEAVPSFSVATLLARHRITQLDLLIIDTEGWDWRILRQFDLAALAPKLILYEHQHLSSEDRQSAHALLMRHGYEWGETPEGDTLAWRS